jgi:hypothetical protein
MRRDDPTHTGCDDYVRGHFGDKSKGKVTVSQKASLPDPGAAP